MNQQSCFIKFPDSVEARTFWSSLPARLQAKVSVCETRPILIAQRLTERQYQTLTQLARQGGWQVIDDAPMRGVE